MSFESFDDQPLEDTVTTFNGSPPSTSAFPIEGVTLATGPSPFSKTLISISGVILISIILLGNGLVILLLFRFRQLRTPTNYLILGMASADFTTGIVLIASLILRLKPEIRTTPKECLVFWSAGVFPGCTSVLTLLFVSLDRYLKVLLPLRYQTIMSNTVAIYSVACIYVYSAIAMFVLPWVGFNQTHKDFNIPCFFQLSKIFDPIYIQVLIYLNILLPLVLICFMYGHLFRVVMQKLSLEKIQGNPAALGIKYSRLSYLKREIKTIKTLVMLLGLCICGWVPVVCIVLAEIYNPGYQAGLGVRTIVGYLTFINSAINPIMYSLRSEQFRQSARRMICGKQSLKRHRLKRRDATVHPMSTFAISPLTKVNRSETIA